MSRCQSVSGNKLIETKMWEMATTPLLLSLFLLSGSMRSRARLQWHRWDWHPSADPTATCVCGETALRTIELHHYIDCHRWGWSWVSWGGKQWRSVICEGLKIAPQCGRTRFGIPFSNSSVLWESGFFSPNIQTLIWKKQQDCVSASHDPLHQRNPHSVH